MSLQQLTILGIQKLLQINFLKRVNNLNKTATNLGFRKKNKLCIKKKKNGFDPFILSVMHTTSYPILLFLTYNTWNARIVACLSRKACGEHMWNKVMLLDMKCHYQ